MTTKVLIADDSQTIHKVVKITLANKNYELVQASNEAELFQKLSSDINLVLLDFTLSDNSNGYELATKIREKAPKSSILVMLGTFDSIEDSKMIQAGIDDKITKPFESDKFIKKCEELINSDGSSTFVATQDMDEEEELADGWVVDSPEVEETEPETIDVASAENENALHDEMMGWGVEVPGVIEAKSTDSEFPPVIEGQENVIPLREESIEASVEESLEVVEEETVESNVNEDETVVPDESDLEYPDDMGVDYVGSTEEELKAVTYPGSKENDMESEINEDATDPNFQMPEEFKVTENVNSEVELEAEVEADSDVSAEEFWAADDEDETPLELSVEEASEPVLEEKEAVVEEVVAVKEEQASVEKVVNVQIDEDKVVERVTNALAPILENMVKEMCNDKVEQVAWEVIPDLAENLIRKEIKDISSSVMSDQ